MKSYICCAVLLSLIVVIQDVSARCTIADDCPQCPQDQHSTCLSHACGCRDNPGTAQTTAAPAQTTAPPKGTCTSSKDECRYLVHEERCSDHGYHCIDQKCTCTHHKD